MELEAGDVMIFDSHCHLNDDLLYPQIENVIQDAIHHDVGWILCIGYDRTANARAIEIAERYPFVYAAVGYHPEIAHTILEEDWTILTTQLKHPKVVAIGECGLDYYWDKSHKTEQIAVFIRQIQLANDLQKPLVVHMREATEDTYESLQKHKLTDQAGVMHCYSGSVESMNRFLALNMNISFAGPLTFKNAKTPKEVAFAVPEARMMIETDSPYLTPHPFRGKPNGPQYLSYICQRLADLKGMTYEEVAQITARNTAKLFHIDLSKR
jgi:TatD DNase family protein